jgi:hypothetical protein
MAATKKRKGYFYEEEEQAIVDYLKCEDMVEKNILFNRKILPALTKMIEAIIRRYNLYTPDETFQETFDDTISFLLSKIEHFNPESGYKAYSYCGTVCKNYLLYKINQYTKNKLRCDCYEELQEDLDDSIKLSYFQSQNKSSELNELIESTVEEIRKIVEDKDKNKLTEKEVKVGLALISLMENWEDLFARMGSNKFNKSSILLYLKEMTLLKTPEIRSGMRKYKAAYEKLKKIILF